MEKIVSETDTNEVRELTAAELDSVNGGESSLLGAILGVVIEGVVAPVIRAVYCSPL